MKFGGWVAIVALLLITVGNVDLIGSSTQIFCALFSFVTVKIAGLTRKREIFRTGCALVGDADSRSFDGSVCTGATAAVGTKAGI